MFFIFVLCVCLIGKPARVLFSGQCVAAERAGARAGQREGEGQGASEHLRPSDVLRAGAEDPGAAGQGSDPAGPQCLWRSGHPGGAGHRG